MKFFIKDFFSKCHQISSYLQIWSHLLREFLMENFIFFAVFNNLNEELTQPAFTSSKLTIEAPGRRSGVFIINLEHISDLVLVFLLLTLNM